MPPTRQAASWSREALGRAAEGVRVSIRVDEQDRSAIALALLHVREGAVRLL
jgi:hypothetical protein